jgi:hypothetical protein
MIIPFDKKNRAALDKFIDEFAMKSASWRTEFLDRFSRFELDEGGKEFLSNLAKLHFEINQINKDETS